MTSDRIDFFLISRALKLNIRLSAGIAYDQDSPLLKRPPLLVQMAQKNLIFFNWTIGNDSGIWCTLISSGLSRIYFINIWKDAKFSAGQKPNPVSFSAISLNVY